MASSDAIRLTERYLLDTCLSYPDVLDTLRLRPEQFADIKHEALFRALQHMRATGRNIDIVTATSYLTDKGTLEHAGGAAYIAGLTTGERTPTMAGEYAEVIEQESRRRSVLTAARRVVEGIENGADPLEAAASFELEAALAGGDGPRAAYTFMRAADLPDARQAELVRGYLSSDSLTVAYSPPGDGKTAVWLHLLLSMSIGRTVHGAATKAGPVIVFAGEGMAMMRKRFRAWCQFHSVEPEAVPVYFASGPTDLTDPDEVSTALTDLRTAAEGIGTPAAILFDTLNRNFGGGDENSTQDMTTAVSQLDRFRDQFGAAVVVLHHTPKANPSIARGSVALKGAADWEYSLLKDEASTVRMWCSKAKDFEPPAPVAFALQGVTTGTDVDGEPVTGVVAREVEYTDPPVRGKAARGKWQIEAVKILQELSAEHRRNLEAGGFDGTEARVSVDAWRSVCLERNIPRQRFHDARRRLVEQQIVREADGYVSLA